MSNSFIENVNYLASLDNNYGDGIVLSKNNLSLRNVENDVALKFSYFNYDTKQIETIDKVINGMIYTGLETALQEFCAQIESTLGGNKFNSSYSISSSNTGFLIHSFSITINSLDEKLKCTELNFNAKITSTQVEIYNLYGDVINPLKLLAVLGMLEQSTIDGFNRVGENIEEILIVNDNINSVISVSENINNVNNASDNIDNIILVGESILNVNNVGSNIDNVLTASGSADKINTVAENIDNVNIAGLNINSINTVANFQNLSDIIRVADDLNSLDINGIADITIVANDLVMDTDSNILAVSNSIDSVNSVSTNISDIITVSTNIEDVSTLNDNIAVVNTVSGSIDLINTVSSDISNVNTVALNISNINTANENISNINIVSDNILNVNSVAAIDDSVTSVSQHLAEVDIVSNNINNVNTVSTNISDLNTIASQIVPAISEILLADENAAIASTKAIEASNSANNASISEVNAQESAELATEKANLILNLDVQLEELPHGSEPIADFNSGSGVLTISIPESLDGTNGLNAYEIAINNGFVGTESEWLESLNGSDASGDMEKSTYDTNNNGIVDNAQMLTLDIANTISPIEGQIKWNQDEGTADLGLPGGSVLQIGQENIRTIRNGTLSTISNGTLCMFDGTIGNSGRIKVKPFTAGFNEAMYLYGVATQNITSGADGIITIEGKVRDIDTTGASVGEVWQDEDILYAKPNDNGMMTNIMPSDNELKLVVATVIKAHTSGTLEIRFMPFNENMYYTKVQNDILLNNKLNKNADIAAGTATKITYDEKGLITSGSTPTTLSGYSINDAFTKTETNTQISNAISALVDSSPEALNTLNELAAALGDDPSFATTVTNNIAEKVTKNADIVSGTNTKITYDSKGLVTGGSTPTTLSGYSISDAYTKTESDSALDLKVGFDDLDSVNLFRADRYLASQIVSKMLYDVNKKLVKVRYNNNTDVDYEVLSYTDGKLTGVAHYIGGILKGNTVLQYVDGLLDSALFTAI